MDIKDKSGSTCLDSVCMPNNRISVGVRTSSSNGLQSKDLGSSGDEHALKVRKPYTITKQRERWTEEEHKKFLEALKLHGRAWRRIEEHIGTKTAVQIRSHAQKFFSKVVRDSSGNITVTVKPIEIPPPRPKRKPVHPYPRKLGHLSSKVTPALAQSESTLSPVLSVSEQENRSPTSVLSAIGSDTLWSSGSNLPNSCTSPAYAGSNPVGMLLNEYENGCQSHTRLLEEETRSPQADPAMVGLTTQEKSSMELDLGPEDHIPSEECSTVEVQTTSLKLFGRTVLITDSFKPSSSSVGNTTQCCKAPPSVDIESHNRGADMDLQSPAQPLLQEGMHKDLSDGPCTSTWNPWSGMPPMFYCLPVQGDHMNSTKATTIPLPWWAFYGNLPFSLVHPQMVSSNQEPPQSCTETSDHKELQKEGSWTGSNTASVSDGDVVDSPSTKHPRDKVPLQLKGSESSAFRILKTSSGKSARGFVPYRRCVAETEGQPSQMVSDDGEDRTLKLCS